MWPEEVEVWEHGGRKAAGGEGTGGSSGEVVGLLGLGGVEIFQGAGEVGIVV